jgi:hypothetical protein
MPSDAITVDLFTIGTLAGEMLGQTDAFRFPTFFID